MIRRVSFFVLFASLLYPSMALGIPFLTGLDVSYEVYLLLSPFYIYIVSYCVSELIGVNEE